MREKLLPLLLACLLLLPAGCGRTETPVCYYASAQGNNGLLTVSASFTEAGEIAALEVVEHGETPGVCDEALTAVPARILESQCLDVEAVSGATATSRAIVDAAEKAILKAGFSPEDYSGETPQAVRPSMEADVVVVGGGAAGFAAAVSAMEQGSSVILVEKMPAVGGNTLHSGGAFNVVDPEKQAEQGGVDSLELFLQQTWEVGGGRGDRSLIRLLGEQSKSAYEWLKSYGAVWNETFVKANGGLWPRSLEPGPSNTAGDIFLYNLRDALFTAGNTVLTDTRAEQLIKENGVVTGVLCRDVGTQAEVVLRAGKGVVLATGGYAANTEMLNKFNITLPLTSSSQPSNTGDGILMAMQAGAALVDMDKVQLHPSGNPKTGELQFHLVGESIRTISVDIYGRRFVNEEADWGAVTSAVLAQPNKVMYVIMDSKQAGVYHHFEQDLNSGDLLMGDSLAELAHKMGMEEEILEGTVAAYNGAIAAGTADPFGKAEREPIDTPPYFATLRSPVIHYTLGGVRIDEEARALDGKGEPVPGLFAAGEVTGGIHGENRLCGNSLTEAVVFGRIAGESAASR